MFSIFMGVILWKFGLIESEGTNSRILRLLWMPGLVSLLAFFPFLYASPDFSKLPGKELILVFSCQIAKNPSS